MFRLKLEATAFTEELVMGINFIKECLEISDIIMLFFTFFVYRPSLYNLFQMKPTRCTLLLSIFPSPLYMFRATMCPSSGELTVFVRHWYFSLCMGVCLVCLLGWDCSLVAVWSASWDGTAVWWLSGLLVGMGLQSGGCLVCWLGWDIPTSRPDRNWTQEMELKKWNSRNGTQEMELKKWNSRNGTQEVELKK